ncbi:MAG: LysR family transcriptional regulator [Synergistaceae bacterium]|nr:LysR family transcriptional regulator [Synergistaceae bacterium]
MQKEFEYVYAVYQEGSFSKAAKKLYISQPALSALIKKLEKRLRVSLFYRGTKPVELTSDGEFYIRAVERIMSIQQEMDEYFDTLSKARAKQITIGSPSYFCVYVLSDLVRKFQLLHGEVSVDFTEDATVGLSKKLVNEEVDFIFDVENLDERTFNGVLWGYEHIVVAVPTSFEVNDRIRDFRMTAEDICGGRHLRPDERGVDLSVFSDEPILLLKRGSDIYRRVMTMCRKRGFTPWISMYLDQLLTCYNIACRGKGIAFVRDSITRYVERSDKLYFYKIDDDLATRAIKLYYKTAYPRSSPASAFLEFIRSNSKA